MRGHAGKFTAGMALLAMAAGGDGAGGLRADEVAVRVVPADAPYKNLALSFEERAADLVGRMTLTEKAEQAQWLVRPNVELGIPAVAWWSEAIHGVSRAGQATVFPQAIGMAASWDPALMHAVAEATADEARAKLNPAGERYYGIILWAPTVNMARDPRWGRVEETYGEDPHLTGRLAVEFIKGLQGDDPKYLKTVATPKHFAMHSQESDRLIRSFDVPVNVLYDYYLPAFRDCVVEGKATSVMAAFNGINHVPSTANPALLTALLRDEWGFKGAVVTDWGAVPLLGKNGHAFVTSENAAVAAAINAGVDVVSDPRSETSRELNAMTKMIVGAVGEKLLTEETLSRAVVRNMTLRFRLGMFDPKEKVPFTPAHGFNPATDGHLALAQKAAEESFVLLKNDAAPKGNGFEKLLPLDLRKIDSIAILGPNANNFYYGAYSGAPVGPATKLLGAVRTAMGERVTVRVDPSGDAELSMAAASRSDVVIFACGLNGDIEKEGVDRKTLRIPDVQQSLLEKVVKANPNTIVVLQGGSPIGLAWMKENVPAILLVWYPGEQGGAAAARVLLGQVNPSGKLPLTFYRAVDDLPAMDDYDITKGRTYMYLEKAAPFVFGHGLSYTTYEYRNLQVTPKSAADGTISVSLEVANTGGMDGDEIVQVYVREKNPPAGVKRPIKQLKGFSRVTVGKGRSAAVKLTVPAANLGFWDVSANRYVVDLGVYEVMAGASSEDIRERAEVVIQ